MPNGVKATCNPTSSRYAPTIPAARKDVLNAIPATSRRQGKRQVDHCVDKPAAAEAIAHQNPGEEQTEHRVDQRRNRGAAEADTQRRDGSLVKREAQELRGAKRRAAHNQRGQRKSARSG
jgi:hypothetical protein